MGILSWFFKKDNKEENNNKNISLNMNIKKTDIKPLENKEIEKTHKTIHKNKITEEEIEPPKFKNTNENFGMNADIKEKHKDSTWMLKHFIDISTYFEWSKSIIAMMCVKLEGISIEEYKYSGFMYDLLLYILHIGKKLLNDEEAEALIESKIPKGKKGLENILNEYKKQLANYLPNEENETKHDDTLTKEDEEEILSEKSKTSFAEKLGGLAHGDGKTPPDEIIEEDEEFKDKPHKKTRTKKE